MAWVSEDPSARRGKHRSRRLISLYYYTKTRPERRDIVYRTTFFCPYFPERLKDPCPLSEEDRGELVEAIQKRDRWLQYYQEREIEVRKSYGYSAPGDEPHVEVQEQANRRRSSPGTRSGADLLGRFFKDIARHFIALPWWRSKRAPTPPPSRGEEPHTS